MTHFESCPECDSSEYTIIETAQNTHGNSVRTELLQCAECGAAWDSIPGSTPRQGLGGRSTIQVKPSTPKN
jgi:uncharacterized Zn finger protein